MTRRLGPAAATLAAWLCATAAFAQTSPAVRRIEQLYLESDYEAALRACEVSLRDQRAPRSDHQEALKYMGTILFAQGDTGEARSAFARLLRIDPRYRLPTDWPPRVLEFFERLRAEALPPPRIRHRVPRGFRLGSPIAVSSQILFLTESHQPRLYYRIRGTTTYSAVDMGRDQEDVFTGIVPTTAQMSPDHDTFVEYYIAVEEGGRTVLTEGTAARPHSFVVGRVARAGGDENGTTARSGGTPWLLIGLSGAAAVALGVGAFFLFSAAADDEMGSVAVNIGLEE